MMEKMYEKNIEPNAVTFGLVLQIFLNHENPDHVNLELVLRYYAEMLSRKFVPDVDTAQRVIIFAASRGYPRLALDFAATFEESSVRRLEGAVWINCLRSSAEALYAGAFIQHRASRSDFLSGGRSPEMLGDCRPWNEGNT
jgi:hypothetical protein